jgi:hypothetical protein
MSIQPHTIYIPKGFITLTTITGSEIRIKIDHIGHYFSDNKTKQTVVGVTTHNNGGFKVTQTTEEIDELISCNQ